MKVELYTKNNCKQCIQAKKFLIENNIEFVEKNISINIIFFKEYSQYKFYLETYKIPIIKWNNLFFHVCSPVKLLSFKILYQKEQKG